MQVPQTPKGFNRYAYVFNNPLSFTDPSGFFTSDHGGVNDDGSSFGGGPGSEGNDGLGGGSANGSSSGGHGGNDNDFTRAGDPGDQASHGRIERAGYSRSFDNGYDPTTDHLGRRHVAREKAARTHTGTIFGSRRRVGLIGLDDIAFPDVTPVVPIDQTVVESGFSVMDGIHAGLDAAGMVPAIGAIADLLNAGLYAIEGDLDNAVASGISAIPGPVGWASTATKYGVKAKKAFCSFRKGTLIVTPDGATSIEDVSEGTEVWAYSFQTKERVKRKVTKVHRGNTRYWIEIKTGDGDQVATTPSHKFWVESESRWIEAKNLHKGMLLMLARGTTSTAVSIAVVELSEKEETFNFEVEKDRNYFVGQSGILVHNGHPDILGTELSNKSAEQSARDMTRGQVNKAKEAIGRKTDIGRIDVPNRGDYLSPQPHAESLSKKNGGWSLNMDGTRHDATKKAGTPPKAALEALKNAGWNVDC